MSFILDALKKSEIERQRQSVPGLMDAGALPRRARFPAWAVAVAALLAVNLAVLVVVLARGGLSGAFAHHAMESRTVAAAAPGGGTTAPGPGEVSSGAPPAAAEAGQTERHFSPMDGAPPEYAPEIPAAEESLPSARPLAPEPAPRAAQHAGSRAPERDPVLTGADKSDAEVLPSISELNLKGADGLPDLHLDVHVYASRPADRFVYINMRKYREGGRLEEGPVLERIRRDGVVLDYRGLRFVLPRQQ
jgi:general secretion pathway protein B